MSRIMFGREAGVIRIIATGRKMFHCAEERWQYLPVAGQKINLIQKILAQAWKKSRSADTLLLLKGHDLANLGEPEIGPE